MYVMVDRITAVLSIWIYVTGTWIISMHIKYTVSIEKIFLSDTFLTTGNFNQEEFPTQKRTVLRVRECVWLFDDTKNILLSIVQKKRGREEGNKIHGNENPNEKSCLLGRNKGKT